MQNKKLDFINILRGISCIIILFSHLFFNFFLTDDWSLFPYIPLLSFDNRFVSICKSFIDYLHFNCGAFGVALFFLITGFVTVMSLEKDHSIKYVIKRIFRLYPTYIVGFSLTFFSIYTWCQYTKYPFPFSIWDYLIHLSLFRNILCGTYIDNVVWTLEVNMDFYILMFTLYNLAPLVKKKINAKHIFILSIIIFVFSIFYYKCYSPYFSIPHINYPLYVLGDISFFLLFIMIGVIFYYLYSNQLAAEQFLHYLTIMILEAIISNYCRTNPVVIESYLYAIAIFGVAFAYRNNIKVSKFIGFISNISYPMYIIHGLNGYILMSFLISKGFNPYLSLLLYILLATGVAYLLHITIDKGSDKICKKILNLPPF